jgi:membrane protease YdiL (CAAX protease family)
VTAPDRRDDDGRGFVDWLVMPGGPSEASSGDGADAADSGHTGEPSWGRRIGALLFWGLAQTLAVLPRHIPFDAAHFQPLLPPLAGLAFCLALAAAFVWRFVLRHDATRSYRRETFRLRAPSPAVLRRLPLVAVPLLAMVIASLILVPRFLPIPRDRGNPLDLYLKLPYATLTVLAIVSIVAPLLEEFLFRGWIQRRMERRLPAAQAIVITAVLFAAAHGEAFGFPTRLLFGLVAGHVAWSTRSIWPGVMLHGLYNATLVLGGSSSPDVDEDTLVRWAHTPSIFWPTLAGFVVCAVLLMLALRSVQAAARRAE